jgi:hypothetical protein
MRTFSSAVQTVLNSDTIEFTYLIELKFDSTYRFTSYNTDLTYDGNVYTAEGGLYEFDTPKFSSTIDREAYKIVVTDFLNEMAAEFDLNVIGKAVEVKVALMDSNGNPMLGTDDVLSVYSGFVDSPSISNNYEEKLALLECTSPMSDLDTVNSFYTSRDSMQQRSLTDTSFDEIFENKEISIKWGKV